jgi:hypothetical protein
MTTCRHCKTPLVGAVQHYAGKTDILVTCDNPMCPLEGYTFTLARYATIDLAPYLESKKAARHVR